MVIFEKAVASILVFLAFISFISLNENLKPEYFLKKDIYLQKPFDIDNTITVDFEDQNKDLYTMLPDKLVKVEKNKEKITVQYLTFEENKIFEGKEIDLNIPVELKEDNELDSPYSNGRAILERSIIMWEGKLYPVIKHTVSRDTTEGSIQNTEIRVMNPSTGEILTSISHQERGEKILQLGKIQNGSTSEWPTYRENNSLTNNQESAMQTRAYNRTYSGDYYLSDVVNGLYVQSFTSYESKKITFYNPLTGEKIQEVYAEKEEPINIIGGNSNGIIFSKFHMKENLDKAQSNNMENKNGKEYMYLPVGSDIKEKSFDKIPTSAKFSEQYIYNKDYFYEASYGNYALLSDTENTIYIFDITKRQVALTTRCNTHYLGGINTISPDGKSYVINGLYFNINEEKFICPSEGNLEGINVNIEYIDNNGFAYGESNLKEYGKININNNKYLTIDRPKKDLILSRPYYINNLNQGVFFIKDRYLIVAKVPKTE